MRSSVGLPNCVAIAVHGAEPATEIQERKAALNSAYFHVYGYFSEPLEYLQFISIVSEAATLLTEFNLPPDWSIRPKVTNAKGEKPQVRF